MDTRQLVRAQSPLSCLATPVGKPTKEGQDNNGAPWQHRCSAAAIPHRTSDIRQRELKVIVVKVTTSENILESHESLARRKLIIHNRVSNVVEVAAGWGSKKNPAVLIVPFAASG